jgi:hypothetical protein
MEIVRNLRGSHLLDSPMAHVPGGPLRNLLPSPWPPSLADVLAATRKRLWPIGILVERLAVVVRVHSCAIVSSDCGPTRLLGREYS